MFPICQTQANDHQLSENNNSNQEADWETWEEGRAASKAHRFILCFCFVTVRVRELRLVFVSETCLCGAWSSILVLTPNLKSRQAMIAEVFCFLDSVLVVGGYTNF